MKSAVYCMICLCGLAPALPAAQRPRLIHADSLVYRQQGERVIQDLWGNVQFVQDSAYLNCQHARWWQEDDKMRLEQQVSIHDGKRLLKGDVIVYNGKNRIETAEGHVSLEHNNRLLTADRLIFHQDDELAEALDNVQLSAPADSVRIESDFMTYNQKLDYGLLLKNPVLTKLDTAESENIVVKGDTMQIWGETERVLVSGNVSIKKGNMSSNCQQAEYLMQNEKLILTLTPQVFYDEQQMSGDSIVVNLKGTRFEGVELHGKAEILSTDSSNTDRLLGRQIVLNTLEDSVRTVIIEGQAISEYNITEENADDQGETGFNKVTGDRIILTFVNSSLKRVRVESEPALCTGEFKPDEKP